MFEYLMPSIWMRSYPNTLLDRAAVAAVRSQQEYAESKGILWGISESACARRNEAGDYHYEAFGVPTFVVNGDATFVRYMVPPTDDGAESAKIIESLITLMALQPDLNEFKHTRLPY